jgi:hypothetical protein
VGWPSLFILHVKPGYPRSVIFQPLRFATLESLLVRNGYQIVTQEPGNSTTEPVHYPSTVGTIAYIAGTIGVIVAIAACFVALK